MLNANIAHVQAFVTIISFINAYFYCHLFVKKKKKKIGTLKNFPWKLGSAAGEPNLCNINLDYVLNSLIIMISEDLLRCHYFHLFPVLRFYIDTRLLKRHNKSNSDLRGTRPSHRLYSLDRQMCEPYLNIYPFVGVNRPLWAITKVLRCARSRNVRRWTWYV